MRPRTGLKVSPSANMAEDTDGDLHIVKEVEVYKGREGEVQQSVTGENKEETGHPWPFLKSIFHYKGRARKEGYRVKFTCCLCPPVVKEIYAFKSLTSNLRKHVEVSSFACICLYRLVLG